MNGAQDLGGMMGFGKVLHGREDRPVFDDAAEKRVLGLVLAMGATGSWSIDASRHARETLPPVEYLSASYAEKWIKGMTRLLIERGLVSIHELYGDEPVGAGKAVARVLRAEDVADLVASGSPYERPATRPARFAVGDSIVARNDHPVGHTRLPRYVRGRPGTIAAVNGVYVFPDSLAHGGGENPDWCYSVRFRGQDLWGRNSDPQLIVMADLWESYLDPA